MRSFGTKLFLLQLITRSFFVVVVPYYTDMSMFDKFTIKNAEGGALLFASNCYISLSTKNTNIKNIVFVLGNKTHK